MPEMGRRAFGRANCPASVVWQQTSPTRPHIPPKDPLPKRTGCLRWAGRQVAHTKRLHNRRKQMRRAPAGTWLAAGTILSSQLLIATAIAQTAGSEDLLKMQANAANVVMPTITYDNQRYSALDQINAQNVGKLQ